MSEHPHSRLIDAVGTDAVRRRYELTPQALYGWRRKGIPKIRRLSFALLAKEKAVELPDDFIEVLVA